MVEPVTIVVGRISTGGNDADEESNKATSKHTARGFRRDVPATQPGLRVPQDRPVARRGRGVHHQIQRPRLLNGQQPYADLDR